jgi:hypothetical protein
MSKRCSAKNRSGKRCGAWAVTGATECALHADPEQQDQTSEPVPFPAPGESIDDTPTPPKSPALARVITVEVG